MEHIEPFVTLGEVAEKLGMHVATLRKFVDAGELAVVSGVFQGERTRWSWVEYWLSEHTLNPEMAVAISRKTGGE